MAELLIKSSLNPSQILSVRVSLRQVVIEGIYMEDLPENVWAGDLMWIIEAATSAYDCDGSAIQPVWSYVRSFATIDEEITDLVNRIAERVCWDNLEDDKAPYVVETYPVDGATNVIPDTSITLLLRDDLPSTGIDISTLKVTVKGYDITDKVVVEGGPFEYTLKVTPGTEWQSALFEEECG